MTGKYWDRAWSLVDGCTPCSPGCDNCWSMAMGKRFNRWPPYATEKWDRLYIPRKTKGPTVFAVWNDLFHERIDDGFVDKILDEINCRYQQHTFLVLTKRPAHVLAHKWNMSKIPNLWLGVTVCNQQEADEKIPILLQTPAAHKLVSIEPMLGPVDLTCIKVGLSNSLYRANSLTGDGFDGTGFHAVILGGETGPHARPMHPDWVRSVRDQCAVAGVPFFFKQWGKHLPALSDRIDKEFSNKLRALDLLVGDFPRHLDGRTHDDLPWRRTV